MAMNFVGGLPETRCGAGSTLAHTESIRQELPKLFSELGIRTLVDAPCGDFNWMSQTDLSGIDYIGCDVDDKNLRVAESRSSNANSATFIKLDIVEDKLPQADMILCRDFLQHLRTDLAIRVLRKLLVSEATWLLMTCHFNLKNEDIALNGQFRPLNLMANPFMMPLPVKTIDDGNNMLGLWRSWH